MNMPIYENSAFKVFERGEIHVTRTIETNVLLLMTHGTLRFYEDGKLVTLNAGEWYVQRAELFQQGADACDGAEYYYIHFAGDIPCKIRGERDFSLMLPLFERLDFLFLSHADQFLKNAVFYSILDKLCGDAHTADDTVSHVLKVVMRDLSKRHTLDELSRLCGYSKNHLINVFKRQTGLSPVAYIANIRHERAKMLLRDSTLPISNVAQKTGYTDYVNFYKDFVKREGITPTDYRKNRM